MTRQDTALTGSASVIPSGVHTFETIESHTAGNPTRTVLSGVPNLTGATMLAKMHDLRGNHDWIRTALMFEPRGSSVMSGCVLTEPCDNRADVGVVFIESSGYPPMCGHDTIGLITVLIQTGRLAANGSTAAITLDTPAGLVSTEATIVGGRVTGVSFNSTPSFLMHRDFRVHVDGTGEVTLDIAWGGNFYAIVDASSVRIDLDDEHVGNRIALAQRIRAAVNAATDVAHPLLDGVRGVTHVQFVGPPKADTADSRSSVIMPPGGADRSPCGTGTSARTAALVARRELALGATVTLESITGGMFASTPVETTKVGPYPAVVNRISGRAFVTGAATWTVDSADPQAAGFLVL